ncbi:MAG: InlB B-repeat-containing protein [Ignavibacteria bacterium]|jgi:uncharacterized repeat protein (TIGR02543 family)|nr:InlB B-repeat-containing protein [Ignavibacteria bacterium]
MKKIIILILLCITYAATFAQPFTPFGLGSTNWIYADSLYPRLGSDAIHYVGASPVFLRYTTTTEFDRYDSVRHCFKVSVANGVTWIAKNNRVNIGANGDVTLVTLGQDTLIASIGIYKKYIPITILEINNDCNSAPIDTFNVTTETADTTFGTTTGTGRYPDGSKAAVGATPKECYHFVKWTDSQGNTKSINANDTIVVHSDTVWIAVFAQDSFNLRLRQNPLTSPIPTGSGRYACGTTTTISAASAPCYHFVNWTDSATNAVISTNPTTTVTISKDQTIIANYQQDTFYLTVNASPLNGGTAYGTGFYACGSQASIRAVANECWEFVCWINELTGDTISKNPNELITMTGNLTIAAHFVTEPFTLYLSAEPAIGGTVNGGTTWSNEYMCGDIATLEAVPNAGYRFSHWYDNIGYIYSTAASDVIQINRNTTLTGYFEEIDATTDSVNLTLIPIPTAGGNAVTSGKYPINSAIKVTATPAVGYRFVNWTATDGEVINSNESFTILLNRDSTLYANFVDTLSGKKYIVTLERYPAGVGTVTGAGAYDLNQQASITATAPTGYQFVNWTTKNGNVASTDPNFTIVVTKDTTFIANFTEKTFVIFVTPSPTFMGNVSGTTSGLYVYNYHAIMTASPVNTDLYDFAMWVSGNDTLSQFPTLDFLVTRNMNIQAIFRDKTGIESDLNRRLEVYPNPSNGTLYAGFNVKEMANVRITLCDILGRELVKAFDGILESGYHTKNLATTGLPAGLYVLRIQIGNENLLESVILK